MNAALPTPQFARVGFRWLLEVLALAGVYFFTARLGLLMAIPGGHITPVWPPSGIALAAMLLRGQRLWPGIWLGSFAANILDFYGSPASLATELSVSAIYGIGASLTALWGAQLLRRFVDKRNPLERVPDVCAFMLLGGVVSCLVSATIGVTTLDLAGFAPWSGYDRAWLIWWLGDIGGVFIVAPLLLVWDGTNRRMTAARWVELLGGFGALIAVTYYVFIENTTVWSRDRGFTFALIPFLIWSAIRFGRRGAATAVGVVAMLAVWGTIHGSGPFKLGSRNESLLALELFLSVISFTALCIATMATEAERKRRRVLDELESRVAERTASLDQANAALRESEARTRLLIKSSNIGLWDWNLVTDDVFFSPEWKSQLGYADDEVPGRYEEWESRLHPEDREPSLRAVKDFREGLRQDYDIEFRLRHKDGSWRSILTRADLIRDAAGQPVRMVGCHIDITARKQAEEKLRESEMRFRELAENIDEVFWIWTANLGKARLLYVSPAYATIWGRSCESLYASPQSWQEGLHPDDKESVLAEIAKLDLETMSELNYRIVRPDGSIRWICDRIFPVRDAHGVVVRFAGIARDMTKSKTIEMALESAKEQYRSIFDNAVDGIFRSSPEGKLLVVNPAAARIFGFASPEESIETRSDVLQGYVDPRRRKELKRLLREHGAVKGFEFEAYRKDGSRVWISENAWAVHAPSGEILYFEGIFADVTERKRAKEALRESEEQMRLFMEATADCLWKWDLITGKVVRSVGFNRVFGYALEEVDSSIAWWEERLHPDDRAKVVSTFQDTLASGGNACSYEYRFRRRDGTLAVIQDRAYIVRDAMGKPLSALGAMTDITERKQAEEALRRSEEKWKALFDLAPVGISVLDGNHNVVDVNRALEKITRLSREQLLNGSWRRRTYLNADGTRKPPDKIASVRAVAEKRPLTDIETGIVTENGEIVWTRVSAATLALPDAAAVVITQDITERKRTEQAQERALSLMLATLESTADGILVVNTEGKIVTFNRLFAQMWHLSEEVLASKEDARALESVLDQLKEPEKFLKKVRDLYRHPEEESFDRLIFKDGRVFERYSRPQLIGGKVAGRVWSFRDVTERKRAQAALRESEERFRLLAEVTNDAIWDWDLVTNELWWNEGFEALFGYSRDEIEKTIDSWYNRIHPAERARVVSGIHRVIDEGQTTWSDEYRFLRKDGSYAYVHDRGQVIRNAEGKAMRMVGGMRDLTERNKAQEAAQALPAELLRAQDDERRRIARELHDSTAQELAVVAMNLGRLEEWIEGRDPWAENLLADSLAVLTQGNRDLRTLAYLLHPPMLEELGLIGAIRDYVEGFSARSGIEVELEFTENFERCSSEIETALFRVVQESLSNVHRHSESEFALVKLARVRDVIELTIADRGRGLPAGLFTGAAEHARIGVGISGMRQRIAQLQGRLDITSNREGTTVRAVLPCVPRSVVAHNGSEG